MDVHHGVTFSFGSAKVCSPAIFETRFSSDKDIIFFVCSVSLSVFKVKMAECRGYFIEVQHLTNHSTPMQIFV